MANDYQLIVGTGVLGKRFYQFLSQGNKELFTLSKSYKAWSQNHIVYDLLGSDEALPELPKLKNVFIILSPTERTEAAYQTIYLDAIRNFIFQLHQQQKDFHCTFVSSISVYGAQQMGLIDEATITQPDNFRGRILLAAEKQLVALHPDTSVVRAAGLYSAKRKKLIQSLTDPKQKDNPKWLNLIHEQDLCHWLRQASQGQWQISLAADTRPFQRVALFDSSFVIEQRARTGNYRKVYSRYIDNIKLKYPSFIDWYKNHYTE